MAKTMTSDAVSGLQADAALHADEVQDEPIPAMQQLIDNPFLLLFIGLAVPTVLYTIWGVMEIVNLPIAK